MGHSPSPSPKRTPAPLEVEAPPLTPGLSGRTSTGPTPRAAASTALPPEHTRTFVEGHVKCRVCGYDLVGLRTDQNCSECGTPISDARRARRARASAHIITAPESWLRTFGIGGVFVILGLAGLLTTLPIRVLTDIWPEFLLGSAAVWWVGIVLTTLPRPKLAGMTVHPAKEWFILRIGSWLSQACMVFGAGLLTAGKHGTLDAIMRPGIQLGIGNALLIVAFLGLAFVYLHWSNLAYWASDVSLMHSLRVCLWLAPAGCLMAFGFIVSTHQISLVGQLLVLFGLVLFAGVPLGYVAKITVEFANVARWAVKNKLHAAEAEERLRERAMRGLD